MTICFKRASIPRSLASVWYPDLVNQPPSAQDWTRPTEDDRAVAEMRTLFTYMRLYDGIDIAQLGLEDQLK